MNKHSAHKPRLGASDAATPPASAFPLSDGQIFGAEPLKLVLENGLVLLFSPTLGTGLLSAQVWVRTGSIHEGALLGSGVSHFVEHMVFKGTKKYNCRDLSQTVQRAGAVVNAYTTFDRTVYYLDGPSECAETAFDVLSEMMFRANFARDDAGRERDVILREIDMRDDDPDSLFTEAVLAEAFHQHPFRLPVIGLRDIFARITLEQLRAYYAARYVPNNMVLVIAGDLPWESVVHLARKHFGAQPPAALAPAFYPEEPAQLTPRSVTLRGDVSLLRGALVWHIPGMRHPDAPALDAFAILLGLGDSSRLNRRLHYDLNLVHGIDASNWTPGATGLLWLSYTADSGRRAEVERAVAEVVAATLADGFSDTEFAKARRSCIMSFLESRKTVHGVATQLGAQAVIVGEAGYPRLYLERIAALTPETVLAAARRHIRPELLTSCAMEPLADAASDTAGRACPAVAAAGPAPFEETTLPNGLRVLLQPARGYPKINYRAIFPGGGAHEPPARRGLSELLATLLTLDTENRSAEQVAETAETLGASLRETAGNNTVGVSIEVLPFDAAAGAELLADALLRPALSEKTFLIERDAQRAALHEEEDDVVAYGIARLRRHFFGKHPLATGPLGDKDDLARTTAADARALYAKNVRPENCVLAVSGDFDRDAMLADLTARFGDWHGRRREAAANSAGASDRAAASDRLRRIPVATGRIEETRPGSQSVVFCAFPDAGIIEDDYIAGQLLDEMLNGMASQIFMNVREERGMAYFVGASRVSGIREGMFYLHAGTIPQHVESVVEAIRRDIARLRAGRFADDEIESAKVRLRVSRRAAAQTVGMRTMNAALNALYGLEVNRDTWWEERLTALKPADLIRFANRHFIEDKALLYIVRPE